jgi:hypothetical protein
MRRAALLLLVGLCVPAVVGCSSRKPAPPTLVERPAPSVQVAHFADIAMPPENVLDLDRTVVFGADREWIGRLALTSKLSVTQVYDFFRQEMPRLGWSEVTSVRSSSAVLTYQMDNRVATIQIAEQRLGNGSQIDFWMNPRGTMPRGEMSVQAAPAPSAAASWRDESARLAPPRPAVGQNATAPAAAPRGVIDEAPLAAPPGPLFGNGSGRSIGP